jgi:hypothetical protein
MPYRTNSGTASRLLVAPQRTMAHTTTLTILFHSTQSGECPLVKSTIERTALTDTFSINLVRSLGISYHDLSFPNYI